MSSTTTHSHDADSITQRERTVLLSAVMIISICALTYELIVATLSSYLLGDSITQFSLTIGFFLFAMGIGSLLSRRIERHELQTFILVELGVAVFGGTSALLLYATFSTISDLYYPVMIAVSLAIGIFIGLEIPLLTRFVANRSHLNTALADVLSVDYIGALLGSLAFPIVLLPLLGVMRTAFLMGMFNICVAGAIIWHFRRRLPVRWLRRVTAGGGVALVGMLAGVGFAPGVVDVFEQQLYRSTIVYTEQTPYQRIVMTSSGRDFRLFLDGNLQFSSIDEYRYHEMLVHPAMAAAGSHEQVLVLGGGDGMVAREVLMYTDVQQITVVDLDPAVTELAQTFPILQRLNQDALNDERVTVVNQDAYTFIAEGSTRYNVIIADLPDPNNESISKLYSDTFYRLMQRRLARDGIFATQATSVYFTRQSFWMIANTIASTGLDTVALHNNVPSFGEWGYVLAAPVALPTLEVPDSDGISLRYLTSDVLAAAHVFDPDMAHVDTAINTLDNPVLPRTYERDWRRWN